MKKYPPKPLTSKQGVSGAVDVGEQVPCTALLALLQGTQHFYMQPRLEMPSQDLPRALHPDEVLLLHVLFIVLSRVFIYPCHGSPASGGESAPAKGSALLDDMT